MAQPGPGSGTRHGWNIALYQFDHRNRLTALHRGLSAADSAVGQGHLRVGVQHQGDRLPELQELAPGRRELENHYPERAVVPATANATAQPGVRYPRASPDQTAE